MKISKTSVITMILCFFIALSYIICEDAEMKVKDVSVKVMGQSGKISITSTQTVEGVEKVDSITINFSALKEKDSDGNEVGKSGSVKHSFNNFATMDFEVSKVTQTKFQNIDAYAVSLTAKDIVTKNSNLMGTFYIFNGKGKINTGGDENVDVSVGSIKFSLDIQEWPFCQNMETCTGVHCCKSGQTMEVGTFLDFDLEISGNKPIENVKKNDYIFGSNTKLLLSSMIKVDDEWKSMAEGYPKVFSQGNKNVFTYRFPIFKSKALYDPVINWQSSSFINISIVFIIYIFFLLA